MSSVSYVFESLQAHTHFLSNLLDAALLEKRYVTYQARVNIRDLSNMVEGLARVLITVDLSGYPSTSIRNRVHFLQSQLQMCVQRNVLTSLYGPGITIPAIQRALQRLQVLGAVLDNPPPKDPSERPEIDLGDLHAHSLQYLRLGFLEKRGSSSPRAAGSFFVKDAFPL